MIYGYGRVSTAGQAQHGGSLEDQEARLLEAGAQEIVKDAFTGTKMERPAFSQLIERLQPGDVLIVTKLDRFARTAAEGVQTIQDLLSRGVVVQVLNMGRIDNSPMGKLMVTMLLAFAEFERDMIIERTQTGKAVARAKGIRVDGRPRKYSEDKVSYALRMLEEGSSYNHVTKITGISKSTLIRAKRAKNLQHPGEQISIF